MSLISTTKAVATLAAGSLFTLSFGWLAALGLAGVGALGLFVLNPRAHAMRRSWHGSGQALFRVGQPILDR